MRLSSPFQRSQRTRNCSGSRGALRGALPARPAVGASHSRPCTCTPAGEAFVTKPVSCVRAPRRARRRRARRKCSRRSSAMAARTRSRRQAAALRCVLRSSDTLALSRGSEGLLGGLDHRERCPGAVADPDLPRWTARVGSSLTAFRFCSLLNALRQCRQVPQPALPD